MSFHNRSSYIQKASEASTVTNPLGCAFVMEPSDTKGLPGTVVCGVCGAVRRYSFILQARKFGTFSCEPCRKFISRVLRARLAVKCTSGSGHCIHPPVLRWNNACPPEDRPASMFHHVLAALSIFNINHPFHSRWRSDDGSMQSLLAETSSHGIPNA